MLAKFETKSARVKGISFHPKRPWILASLHSGAIHLWDYKMGTMVDKFEEHEGPVRGIHFHNTQPLFVSGGDDYKIKVWNYKQSRCLFTLNGHLDYIRTVFFHNELPWIISASDDQTIRIWNWQSRTCISIITGHNHYVMSANFHPAGQELIVSASLDQTVRIWDMSGLCKKHSAGSGGPSHAEDPYAPRPGAGASQQGDYFVNTDVVIKHILEGHDRGVNWAAFHPTLPLIVSAGDDRVVKLWRTTDLKAWEVDSCRGHYNNVSCVLFHPKQDLILSNSEDKTIRIWDLNKRTAVATYRRENDRFWSIVAHPELNLFAAAHDHGMIVFKLERERPAFSLTASSVFYMHDKSIRRYDYENAGMYVMGTTRRTAPGAARHMSYNASEGMVLLSGCEPEAYYELQRLDGRPGGDAGSQSILDKGHVAVFVARNRFAVLDKTSKTIVIKDLSNAVTKSFEAPAGALNISNAGGKCMLIVTATGVILFDTELRAKVKELVAARVRYISWAPDMSHVALISKHTVIIATGQLEKVCTIHETIKLKSGVWTEQGVFLYTTLNHIKFALLNGDKGVIKTLESPVYITAVRANTAYCLSRSNTVIPIPIDTTEYTFKLALLNHQFDKVLHMIQTSNLVGQSIIGYLQKQGYPEVALQFVKDNSTRFELAIAYGNLDVALETARAIDQDVFWDRLAEEALQQGNHPIVEMAYQRTKKFEKLSFLYLLTGNVDKLSKMLKVAQVRNDGASTLHNALYLGDVEVQIALFLKAGQPQLAYLLAKTHGLAQLAASILTEAGKTEDDVKGITGAGVLLKPPTPLLKGMGPWPLKPPSTRLFETVLPPPSAAASNKARATALTSEEFAASMMPVVVPAVAKSSAISSSTGAAPSRGAQPLVNGKAKPPIPAMAEPGGWGEEEADLGLDSPPDPNGEAGGWGDEDLDVDLDAELESAPPSRDDMPLSPTAQGRFLLPVPGSSSGTQWARNSQHVADLAAAGAFNSVLQLLSKQSGVVEFAPLKPYLLAAAHSSRAWLGAVEGTQPIPIHLHRTWDSDHKSILPHAAFSVDKLREKMDAAYALTTAGKFPEAITHFLDIVYSSIFTADPKNSGAVPALVGTAVQYLLGLSMEVHRKELSLDTDARRVCELSAYFTQCQIMPEHLTLALRSAMLLAFKAKNFGHAAHFAARLLELKPQPQVEQQAQKIMAHYERNRSNALAIQYDPHTIHTVCAGSYTPILKGEPYTSCSLCRACYGYTKEFKGTLCKVCRLARVGQ